MTHLSRFAYLISTTISILSSQINYQFQSVHTLNKSLGISIFVQRELLVETQLLSKCAVIITQLKIKILLVTESANENPQGLAARRLDKGLPQRYNRHHFYDFRLNITSRFRYIQKFAPYKTAHSQNQYAKYTTPKLARGVFSLVQGESHQV